MKFQIPHGTSVTDAEFLKDPVARMKVLGERKSSSQLTEGKKLAHKEGVSDLMSEQTIPKWQMDH